MGKYGSFSLYVVATVQGVVAILLVGAACYCWISGVELPSTAVALLWAILGAYFGFSAHLGRLDARFVSRIERLRVGEDGE